MESIKISENKDFFDREYYDIEDPLAYIESIMDRFDILYNDLSVSEYSDKFVTSFLVQTNRNEICLDLCFNIPGGFDNITSRYKLTSGIYTFDKFYKGITKLIKGCRYFFRSLKKYESYLKDKYGYKKNSIEMTNYRRYIAQIDICSSQILTRVSDEVEKLINDIIEEKRKGG